MREPGAARFQIYKSKIGRQIGESKRGTVGQQLSTNLVICFSFCIDFFVGMLYVKTRKDK